jgi:hypothetical protein
MELLTYGTEKNPILGFCSNVISRHGRSWPPEEIVLAEEFVQWLGFNSFLTKEALKELCQDKGVNLTVKTLPAGLRGFNCSYQDKREIFLTDEESALFSDAHTLFHEFREMLEHSFVELGYPTIGAEQSLEVQAETFAMACRMRAVEQELPAFFKLAQNVEKPWARYLAYTLFAFVGAALFYSCILVPQIEEILAEAKRLRYVRT